MTRSKLKCRTLVLIICICILSSNIRLSTRLRTLTPSPSRQAEADAVLAPPSAFEGGKLSSPMATLGGVLMVNWLIIDGEHWLITDGQVVDFWLTAWLILANWG